jgi:hypothetical protein
MVRIELPTFYLGGTVSDQGSRTGNGRKTGSGLLLGAVLPTKEMKGEVHAK